MRWRRRQIKPWPVSARGFLPEDEEPGDRFAAGAVGQRQVRVGSMSRHRPIAITAGRGRTAGSDRSSDFGYITFKLDRRTSASSEIPAHAQGEPIAATALSKKPESGGPVMQAYDASPPAVRGTRFNFEEPERQPLLAEPAIQRFFFAGYLRFVGCTQSERDRRRHDVIPREISPARVCRCVELPLMRAAKVRLGLYQTLNIECFQHRHEAMIVAHPGHIRLTEGQVRRGEKLLPLISSQHSGEEGNRVRRTHNALCQSRSCRPQKKQADDKNLPHAARRLTLHASTIAEAKS